jgi:hypothetical protein
MRVGKCERFFTAVEIGGRCAKRLSDMFVIFYTSLPYERNPSFMPTCLAELFYSG